MRATPIQTGTTTVLATACGLLSAWYVPAFILSVAVGAIAYLTAVVVIAKLAHLDPLALIADTTRLAIRITATTITVIASLLLNALAAWGHAIHRTQQTTTHQTIYSRAA